MEYPFIAGQKLRQAREARSLSLEQVAQATRIRVHYLRALEAGDFDAIPSLAQARGFVRAYAGFLGLDGEALLNGEERSAPAAVAQTAPAAALSAAAAGAVAAGAVAAATIPEAAELPTGGPADSPAAGFEGVPEAAPVALPPPPQTSAAAAASPSLPQQPDSEWGAARPILIEIGQRLKRQRELLGLSLEDVERHTHLRQHYLKSLEAGEMEGLPSPVQGRGMLNNYAAFLGLDADQLLLRFADALQARLAAQKGAREQRGAPVSARPAGRSAAPPSRLRRLFSGDVLLGFLLAAFLIGFIAWGAIRIYAMQTELAATPTTMSIADVLLASATPTASATPAPPTPTNALPPALQPPAIATDALSGGPLPAEGQGKVPIYISVRQRTWMRVLVDGKLEFEGRVLPGSAYTFVGDTQVEVLTGNGAALQIYFGQSDLGVMGAFGQVVNRIYTVQGVLNPTPTITPTGAPTTPATNTPAATQPAATTSAPSLP